MARKDDPVFNVKFVQLVENQACLWNYTHPGYSKKEEVQKAWQHVANEIKDTVRNSRERWRTIRSSFLRSLKLARTQTGRGKRKYYLSKYLQFLIPYTKSRACHKQLTPNAASGQLNSNPGSNPSASPTVNAGGMVLRKPSTSTTAAATATATATFLAAAASLGAQPTTRIGHLRLLGHHANATSTAAVGVGAAGGSVHDEDTKDSNESDAGTGDAPPPLEVHVSEMEEEEEEDKDGQQQHQQQHHHHLRGTSEAQAPLPLRLQAIKVEHQQQNEKIVAAAQHSLVTLPVTMAALRNNLDWTELTEWLKGNASGSSTSNINTTTTSNNMLSHLGAMTPPPPATSTPAPSAMPAPPAAVASGSINGSSTPPDADYSFLISLHPYLKEMSGKQNRRFRQKVVGLIDNVLDNVDV